MRYPREICANIFAKNRIDQIDGRQKIRFLRPELYPFCIRNLDVSTKMLPKTHTNFFSSDLTYAIFFEIPSANLSGITFIRHSLWKNYTSSGLEVLKHIFWIFHFFSSKNYGFVWSPISGSEISRPVLIETDELMPEMHTNWSGRDDIVLGCSIQTYFR